MTEIGDQRCFNRNFGVNVVSWFGRAARPFVVLVLIGADNLAKDVKKDHDLLQGEWTAVSLETGGKESDCKEWKLYVRNDEWTVKTPNGQTVVADVIKMAPSKDPKQIDLSYKGSRGKGLSSLGIYKVDDDTLSLCRTWAPRARPKEFKTSSEGGILIVWKHVMDKE